MTKHAIAGRHFGSSLGQPFSMQTPFHVFCSSEKNICSWNIRLNENPWPRVQCLQLCSQGPQSIALLTSNRQAARAKRSHEECPPIHSGERATGEAQAGDHAGGGGHAFGKPTPVPSWTSQCSNASQHSGWFGGMGRSGIRGKCGGPKILNYCSGWALN